MLSIEDINCICVDWKSGSRTLYTQAANNIRVIGAQIAYMISIFKVSSKEKTYRYLTCCMSVMSFLFLQNSRHTWFMFNQLYNALNYQKLFLLADFHMCNFIVLYCVLYCGFFFTLFFLSIAFCVLLFIHLQYPVFYYILSFSTLVNLCLFLFFFNIPYKHTDMTAGKFPAATWKCAFYWAQPGCTHGCRGWSKDTGAGKNYRYSITLCSKLSNVLVFAGILSNTFVLF